MPITHSGEGGSPNTPAFLSPSPYHNPVATKWNLTSLICLCPCTILLSWAPPLDMNNPQRNYVLLACCWVWGFFCGGDQGRKGLAVWLEFCSQVSVPCRQVLLFLTLITATSSAGFSISSYSASSFLCSFSQLSKRQLDSCDLAVPTLFNFQRVCIKRGRWFRPIEWGPQVAAAISCWIEKQM